VLGIGAACARVFHAGGYRVVCCANDRAAEVVLHERLNGDREDTARFIECDVRELEDITRPSRKGSAFGLDVLVNNVDVSQTAKPIDQLRLQEIDGLINLLSCILMTGIERKSRVAPILGVPRHKAPLKCGDRKGE
jgi:NAD(P)-dependent dehydrogenase (short-subunit alcohol dehydrogenase family)